LAVTPEDYDVEIRRFVPGYETMLDEVIGALRDHLVSRCHILDLGAGTGRLSAHVLGAFPEARVTLVDADAEMLGRAKGRLANDRDRITLIHGSFADPLPASDAAVGSLSLHHVHDRAEKCAVYRNILSSLAPSGILVVADAMVPASAELAAPLWRRWTAHLVAHGHTEAEAKQRFSDWAREDRFYGVDEEIAMMQEAGFRAIDLRWRGAPTAVLVGRKGG
jgi:tRNA (cmo5U34)-methyltransferase